MPQFQLNAAARGQHPYYALDDFAKGYVEAMFFTNGDTGDEREDRLNEMGVERLTRASIARIKRACDTFQAEHVDLLMLAYATGEYTPEQAGRDFWFTRQGHGTGFWARDLGKTGDKLTEAARAAEEARVEVWRGWIYHF